MVLVVELEGIPLLLRGFSELLHQLDGLLNL